MKSKDLQIFNVKEAAKKCGGRLFDFGANLRKSLIINKTIFGYFCNRQAVGLVGPLVPASSINGVREHPSATFHLPNMKT